VLGHRVLRLTPKSARTAAKKRAEKPPAPLRFALEEQIKPPPFNSPSLGGTPASTGAVESTQVPGSAVFDEQTLPDGHLLPPAPRQPALQPLGVPVHTLPEASSPQSESFVHSGTQVPVFTSHTGVSPVHARLLPCEHWPHLPPVHAGALGLGHGLVALVPLSPLHGSHVPVPALQTGVAPGQSALTPQPHLFLLGTHAGVLPVHAVLLVCEHCSHLPLTHAGLIAVAHGRDELEPKSPSHV
jgi:hypothetical protein